MVLISFISLFATICPIIKLLSPGATPASGIMVQLCSNARLERSRQSSGIKEMSVQEIPSFINFFRILKPINPGRQLMAS